LKSNRKQRNSSAPAPIQQTNIELEQMRTYLQTKKAERLSKQRDIPSTTTDNQYQSVNDRFCFRQYCFVFLF